MTVDPWTVDPWPEINTGAVDFAETMLVGIKFLQVCGKRRDQPKKHRFCLVTKLSSRPFVLPEKGVLTASHRCGGVEFKETNVVNLARIQFLGMIHQAGNIG